jgi:hypothetical protein
MPDRFKNPWKDEPQAAMSPTRPCCAPMGLHVAALHGFGSRRGCDCCEINTSD